MEDRYMLCPHKADKQVDGKSPKGGIWDAMHRASPVTSVRDTWRQTGLSTAVS